MSEFFLLNSEILFDTNTPMLLKQHCVYSKDVRFFVRVTYRKIYFFLHVSLTSTLHYYRFCSHFPSVYNICYHPQVHSIFILQYCCMDHRPVASGNSSKVIFNSSEYITQIRYKTLPSVKTCIMYYELWVTNIYHFVRNYFVYAERYFSIFSFPRCPRNDLRRFRLPDDVPEPLWLLRRRLEPVPVGIGHPVVYDCPGVYSTGSFQGRELPRWIRRVSGFWKTFSRAFPKAYKLISQLLTQNWTTITIFYFKQRVTVQNYSFESPPSYRFYIKWPGPYFFQLNSLSSFWKKMKEKACNLEHIWIKFIIFGVFQTEIVLVCGCIQNVIYMHVCIQPVSVNWNYENIFFFNK